MRTILPHNPPRAVLVASADLPFLPKNGIDGVGLRGVERCHKHGVVELVGADGGGVDDVGSLGFLLEPWPQGSK